MINKKFSVKSVRSRALHDSFVTMMAAAVRFPEAWDAGNIIATWWATAFPNKKLTEEDLNDETINIIRRQLLVMGGIYKKTLPENQNTRLINDSITFTEE